MNNIDVSKSQELNDYAKLLLENGFTIIAPKNKSTYFHFSKDNKIGYVQSDRFDVSFSTVHKPCKECGSGFGDIVESNYLTIENAEKTFINAPNWAKQRDRNAVVKYKDIADFTNDWFRKDDIILTPKS